KQGKAARVRANSRDDLACSSSRTYHKTRQGCPRDRNRRTMAPMRLPVVQLSSPSHAPAAGFDTGPRSIAAVRVLRITVTDPCNYRCVYCMPEEGVRWLPRDDILSFEEIRDVARAAIEVHGIRRFKLTGGEPTVRHGIVDLVAMLRRLDGIEDLS